MWGKFLSGAFVAGSLALSGCGGDSSDSVPPQKASADAYFVDNAVTGLRYQCNSGNFKLTGEQGLLTCKVGQTVSFYIGDILLGQTKMAAGAGFITPLTLATIADVIDENKMANIARFLISLDMDGNLDNGIQIDPAVHIDTGLMLDFSQVPASFATAAGPVLTALSQAVDGSFVLVSEGEALEHLVVGLYVANAGYYEGSVNRGDGGRSKLAFLVTREGAAYGVNRTVEGMYAASAFDEESSQFDEFGSGEYFKVDGNTGATYFLDAQAGGGKVTGSGMEPFPTFTASRKVAFDPLAQFELVEDLDQLVPFAIDLTGNEDYFIIDYDPEGLMVGTLYSAWGATPPSNNPENEAVPYGIVVADMVSGQDGVMRLMALSTNGYVVDMSIDFNGEEPVLNAKWKHVFENRNGVTSTYVANFEFGDGPEPGPEPVPLMATEKTKTVEPGPGRRGSGSSGMFR